MSKQPLVSIIIPLYNSEAYIEETIQSALNQTWPYKEIIIVDDGSTDHSLAIAKKYESEQVKIFSQPNKGASAARNYGLREAQGDYIQFLDADDLLSTNKIEAQMAALKHHQSNLAIGPTIYFSSLTPMDKLSIFHFWYNQESHTSLNFILHLYGSRAWGKDFGGIVPIHSWLAPVNLIKEAGPWNEELSVDDDGEFFCRVLLKSNQVLYCKDSIAYYRKFHNSSSLSSDKSRKGRLSLFNAWTLKSHHILNRTKEPLAYKVIARNFTELYYSFFLIDHKLSIKAKRIAKENGGLTHTPKFGNPFIQRAQKLINWKLLMIFVKLKELSSHLSYGK